MTRSGLGQTLPAPKIQLFLNGRKQKDDCFSLSIRTFGRSRCNVRRRFPDVA
jgi:hypothetical protein